MKDRKPMQLRLPSDVKDWIQAESKTNGSSENSAVIRAIRESMARDLEKQTA